MSEVVEVDEFQLAQQHWDERYGDVKQQKKHWQYTAFGLLAVLCLALWGLIHVGSLPKTVYVPVAVNTATGETTVLDATDAHGFVMNAKAWTVVKKEVFTRLITDWRTVTTDDKLRKQNWDGTFEWIQDQSKAATDIRNWFAAHNPNTRCLQETVSVEVDSTSSVTDNTFEVWWTEEVYQGGQVQSHKMQGIFTYRVVGTPTSKHNGFGILVTDYTLPLGDYVRGHE